MDNPYVGTEWETSWQEGHDAGVAQPSGEISPPAVLEENQATIYREGVQAGQQDAATQGTPVQINPITPTEPEDSKGTELAATAVFAFGGWAVEGELSGGVAVAVHLLICIAIPAGDPVPDLSDPAAMATAMNTAIRSMGAEDLYLPFCQNPQHSAQGDQVTEQGFWHGNVFTDYWGAYPSAEEHLRSEPDSLGQVGLVHAKADSGGVEWIELS